MSSHATNVSLALMNLDDYLSIVPLPTNFRDVHLDRSRKDASMKVVFSRQEALEVLARHASDKFNQSFSPSDVELEGGAGGGARRGRKAANGRRRKAANGRRKAANGRRRKAANGRRTRGKAVGRKKAANGRRRRRVAAALLVAGAVARRRRRRGHPRVRKARGRKRAAVAATTT
jgi:hypothetical protein